MTEEVKAAWEIVRAQLCDMGDGEEHGDDHRDISCEICNAIWEIDARFERRSTV